MATTSFKCDDDLLKTILKIKKQTGKSVARIINEALRNSFEKGDLHQSLAEHRKLQHKVLFILKEVVRYRENGDEFVKQIEQDFERYYAFITQKD